MSPVLNRSWNLLAGLPPEARIGIWMFEWYWKQPGVPHVAEFVAQFANAMTVRCRLRVTGLATPRQ